MLTKKCAICGKVFPKPDSCGLPDWFGGKRRPKGRRFCSKECADKSLTGKHFSKKNEYKKGNIPWTKGTKGIVKENSGSFNKGQTAGEKNNSWKGDKVGYRALHSWVRRYKGKPKVCEHCGATRKERRLVWANKNHTYKRDLDDWISLCYPCHKKFDA